MTDFASPILQWLNANPQFASLATFLISAAESVAIIGTIVPGSVMMAAIGALVGAGIIPFWSTIFWAILGAIAGDGISYWIGFHFKNRLNDLWPFSTHPDLLRKGKKFFDEHGAKSVFIGRFVGPVRALVPLVAGMLGVRPWRFTVANVTSAIGWAPAYMLPGILLGAASVELPSEIATRFILILILSSLFIILCLWLLKKLFEQLNKEINQFLNWIWKALKKSRYFHLLTAVLKHHNKAKPHGQLTLGFYFLLTCFALLYLLSMVAYQGPQNIFINNALFHFFRSIRSPTADNIMLHISFLGEKWVLLPVSVTLFTWLVFKKRMHTAWHVLSLGVLITGGIELAKILVHSPRPWGVVNGDYSSHFSFPSGHTALAVMYYFAFALLLIKLNKIRRFRYVIYAAVGLLVSTICISRLYFGVHWLTDILGSMLLGAAILMFVILSYNRTSEKRIEPKGVFLTILLTLVISYSISVHFFFDKFKSAYNMVEWPTYTITLNDWWSQQGQHFPLSRVNRVGLPAKTFNVQWIEDLPAIQEILLKNGWEIAPKNDLLRVLYRLTAIQSTEHLPLVPPTYLDKAPVLVLLKRINGSNKLLVLRFWDAYLSIQHSPKPLWLASVEYAPSTYSWLFKRKHSPEVSSILSVLFNTLPKQYDIKQAIVNTQVNKHHLQQPIVLIKPKRMSRLSTE
jgi:membrane protein DedA with SNARE-associated domain/membrane-associated phospholipid phosphatase